MSRIVLCFAQLLLLVSKCCTQQTISDAVRLESLSKEWDLLNQLGTSLTEKSKAVPQLLVIVNRIAKLGSSRLPISEVESRVTSSIVEKVADIIGDLIMLGKKDIELYGADSSVSFAFISSVEQGPSYNRENFNGAVVWQSPRLEISIMCLVNAMTRVGFVIYPKNTSPLRPLPDIQFQIKVFNVFDLIVVKDANKRGEVEVCDSFEFFDMIVLRWNVTEDESNAAFVCAHWSTKRSEWLSEDCTVIKSSSIPREVTCFCDVSRNEKVVEYILYEYVDDLQESVETGDFYVSNDASNQGTLTVTSSSNVEEFRKHEDLLNEFVVQINKPQNNFFQSFVSRYLTNVMLSDYSILVNNSSDEVLENVGVVLEESKLDEGIKSLAISNDEITGVIVQLDNYQLDPPIGFAMTFVDGKFFMATFRADDKTNLNILFAEQNFYSILFSKSVASQNIRYSFLIYPLNKFFKKTDIIDGHRVLAFRVVDIVVSPSSSYEQDQFVTLYFGGNNRLGAGDGNAVVIHGCGYWSHYLAAWTTNGCSPNGDLYRDVCTCDMAGNFKESRTRGQFVSFVYKNYDFNAGNQGTNMDYTDFEFIEASIFGLQELINYRFGRRTVEEESELLFTFTAKLDGTFRMTELTKSDVIETVRRVLIANECNSTEDDGMSLDKHGAYGVCYEQRKVIAFKFDDVVVEWAVTLFGINKLPDTLITNATYLAVRVSNSVAQLNEKFAFFVYPKNIFLKKHPIVKDSIITNFHVVDVVLSPKNKTVNAAGQFVEIYLSQTEYNTTLGCAYWSNVLNDWSAEGCKIALSDAVRVCNCSLAGNQYQSPTGGQYIAYAFTEAYFDGQVYGILGSESFNDAQVIMVQGAALIFNATHLVMDDDFVIKILQVFLKMVSQEEKDLKVMKQTLSDIEIIFSRFRIDPALSVVHSSGIRDSWSVKSTDISSDLYSNAVLSASASSTASDMTYVALGYQDKSEGLIVVIARKTSYTRIIENATNFEQVLKTHPLFAWLIDGPTATYSRLIFIVYPANKLSYPITMTTKLTLNARQMDVYLDVNNEAQKSYYVVKPTTPSLIEVYFQPEDRPKTYARIGCASWDDVAANWTDKVCQMNETSQLCRCNITDRGVTRISMYEYASNFQLQTHYEGPSIVYLFGASVSLVGFTAILLTALVFPEWREELGQKFVMQLSVSSFFYLVLTMYRETHLILADSLRVNVPLIVFSACVHYTRLAHYFWGLSMAVLQYLTFSGKIGMIIHRPLLPMVSAFAWGLPAVPVVILLLWNAPVHFTSPHTVTHYILYLVPGTVITLVNIGLMIAIIYHITNRCGKEKETGLVSQKVADKHIMKRRLKQIVMMFFLFGLPAFFELINGVVMYSIFLEYVSKTLDPLQGFMLFLFFVILDKRTLSGWRTKLCGVEARSLNLSRLSTVMYDVRRATVRFGSRRGSDSSDSISQSYDPMN